MERSVDLLHLGVREGTVVHNGNTDATVEIAPDIATNVQRLQRCCGMGNGIRGRAQSSGGTQIQFSLCWLHRHGDHGPLIRRNYKTRNEIVGTVQVVPGVC